MRISLHALIMVVLMTLLASCAGKGTGAAKDTPQGGDQAVQATYDAPNFYYEFDDILIPKEMARVDDESYTMDTKKFRVSLEVFEGRVVVTDVINFFTNNMPKDNWQTVAALKGEKSVLIFEKFNKSCMVQIVDGFKVKLRVFAVEARENGAAASGKRRSGVAEGDLPK
ncbi:MAG: hypothetical protein PHV85_01930 [Desulfovibrionaceae bacterium]|nr:hypothetical protein [Desulfovibrionaceae bacterium]